MLISDEGEDDVFFDSVDCLPSEETIVANERWGCGRSEYEIWIHEPQSVKERRESFLSSMGFNEFYPESKVASENYRLAGMERIAECSGAVTSSSASSVNVAEEKLDCREREMSCQANSMVDDLEQEQNVLSPTKEFEQREAQAHTTDDKNDNVNMMKFKTWWKHLVNSRKGRQSKHASEVSKPILEGSKTNRMKVQSKKKQCMELTALCLGQEIQAHKGLIWTMKFSPDGQYLASGGEDGVVRIWRVTSVDASCKLFMDEGNFGSKMQEGKLSFGRKKLSHTSVFIPNKIFQIEESPVQELHGHASDVLDLAWSNSNLFISSSKDKTVRLWQVGCNHCLSVFRHNNYVTCIQFNPWDDNRFISGSIDGKVRIWGVSERRVIDWADVRDVITAICYQPDGKGFIVGSITGTCRFYEASGNDVKLEAEIHIQGRKKNSGNKITGIQFCKDESRKVMITSEDSKVRILDGVDVIHKFKGLARSGSQMSASLASTGKHIISVGEDCHVYVWNYVDTFLQSSKRKKSVISCEHFFCEDVSVAVPWSSPVSDQRHSGIHSPQCRLPRQHQTEDAPCIREAERYSLGCWFPMDVSCRGSATWPEEKLPLWDLAIAEDEYNFPNHQDKQQQQQHRCNCANNHAALSDSWGLVIVTAGWDGRIRTFHNYGLPVRL